MVKAVKCKYGVSLLESLELVSEIVHRYKHSIEELTHAYELLQ